MRVPKIELITGDILEVSADVLALKYAQAHYGADSIVAARLVDAGEDPTILTPNDGDSRLVPSRSVIACENVLFVGVPPLRDFYYREVRVFARRVLAVLAREAPSARHVLTTLHGVGYGLDETEAFESEIAGFLDGFRSDDAPARLGRITIAERNPGRSARLREVLDELLPRYEGETDVATEQADNAREERLRAAGYASKAKEHIFVAMPFKEEMDDVYHYGIHSAVRDAGFVCERADMSSFTGDILQWVRERIKTATLLVADLSDANPNVYLEVGYAWGCDVPTILLARDAEELKFDVRGQRCLIYRRIKDLEEALRNELRSLKSANIG